jgi:Flp pilus assembly protein TadG
MHRCRGQNTVEFAISVGLIMVLTTGLVDLGRAVWLYNTVSNLARDGARYGVVPSRTVQDIKNYICKDTDAPAGRCDPCPVGTPNCDKDHWSKYSRALLLGLDDFNPSNVTVDDRGTCGVPNDPVIVTVQHTFQPLTAPLWGAANNVMTLQATSRMYVEKGAAGAPAC